MAWRIRTAGLALVVVAACGGTLRAQDGGSAAMALQLGDRAGSIDHGARARRVWADAELGEAVRRGGRDGVRARAGG